MNELSHSRPAEGFSCGSNMGVSLGVYCSKSGSTMNFLGSSFRALLQCVNWTFQRRRREMEGQVELIAPAFMVLPSVHDVVDD